MKKEIKKIEQEARGDNRKSKIILIVLLLIILGIGSYFYWTKYIAKETSQEETEQANEKMTLSSKIAGSHISKVGPTKGVYWIRQMDLVWNEIEPSEGNFNWQEMDERVKAVQEVEAYSLVIIQPFANWDQEKCHPEDKYLASEEHKMAGDRLKLGVPCNMENYKQFLKLAIERYDGDGVDDMPGLKRPLKYWEVLNEPIMQGGETGGAGEDLKFFVGSNQEYLEILEASYEAIKEADSSSQVLHAGMAGMQEEVQDFWGPIYEQAGNYFDIANNHTISTENNREDLYMVKFNNFLKKYGNEDKPVWLTEVQYGDLMEEPEDIEEIDRLMVKSTAFSFAQGAEKLFYIQNWIFWQEGLPGPDEGPEDNPKEPPPKEDQVMGEKDKKEEEMYAEFKSISQEAENSSTHQAYLNIVDKLNYFDKVISHKEEYRNSKEEQGGAISEIGQYEFVKENSPNILVLWGKSKLAKTIEDKKFTVYNIYGQKEGVLTKNELEKRLSEDPIFAILNIE